MRIVNKDYPPMHLPTGGCAEDPPMTKFEACVLVAVSVLVALTIIRLFVWR
jgi:hypothetical protein